MAITMSNCMVTGAPLLVTNWEDVLTGVVSPLGSARISKSPLAPSAGAGEPRLRSNDWWVVLGSMDVWWGTIIGVEWDAGGAGRVR